MRSAAPLAMQSKDALPLAFEQYWNNGTVAPDQHTRRLPNSMFAALTSDDAMLHYGSDPVLGYHLATAFAPLSVVPASRPENESINFPAAKAAKKQFLDWVSSFRATYRDKIVVRFEASDAFAFCHTLQHASATGETSANWYRRQWASKPLQLDEKAYRKGGEAPKTFDMIDTSNLSDHFGTLNLLVSCGPLLTEAPWATVYTDSLIQQGDESQEKAFAKLLQGHAATVSLLLGLVPVQYWANAKCDSHVDEILLSLLSDTVSNEKQLHGSLFWKPVTQLGDGTMGSSKLHVAPTALSRIIFGIYLQMFENEKMPSSEAGLNARNKAYTHFHRGSFAAFLKLVKSRVETDWQTMFKELLEKIGQDQSVVLGSNQMQELLVQLHLMEVGTDPWVLNEVRSGAQVGILHKWKDVPPAVALTVVVPRQALDRLYGNAASKMASPTLVGSLRADPKADTQWHNIYADVHITFGRVQIAENQDSGENGVKIEPDELGWSGTSPLIASFMVPTAALQVNPETALVGISVLPSAQNSILYGPVLGGSMNVFETDITNKPHIHVSSFLPNLQGHRTVCGGAREPSAATDGKTVQKVHIDVLPADSAIQTLTNHADIVSEEGKTLLSNKAPIELRQKTPFVIEVVFAKSKLVCPLTYPMPVTTVGSKTRIARTSGYIEVIAPLDDPVEPTSLADFLFPTTIASDGLPVALNTSHLNLDELPVLDLERQDEMRWLTTLTSLQFSVREMILREGVSSKTGIADNARVNFKESLFTMFMVVSGLQGGQTGLFAISHPERGGIHMLIFVSALRLDSAAASVVLDAAVIPLTINLIKSGAMEDFLLLLRTLECCTLNVNDAELELWKKNLPSMAERCRTWSHRNTCEYNKKRLVPLGLGHGEQLLCTCGAGVLPEKFVSLPEWETAAPNATRIAISPTYSVPFVERVADLDMLAEGKKLGGKDMCRNCGATETPDGGSLKKCLRCQKVKYCSGECQKKDWKKHRMECREADEA